MQAPYELIYDINIMSPIKQEQILNGWDKIEYNIYQNNADEIIRRRFSSCTDHLPGFDKVFEMMSLDMKKSNPLREMNKLKFSGIIDDTKDSNISEFKDSKSIH